MNRSTLQTVMKNKKMNMNHLFKNLGRADITSIEAGADDSGRYLIDGVDTDDNYFYSTSNGQSMWQINFGLAYRF